MGTAVRERPERLAEKLLEIRTRLGLGQSGMARALSTDTFEVQGGWISRFENGARTPSLLVLLRYARLAKVPMEALVDDELDLPW